MFYQAVNLTEDIVILKKELLKLKRKVPSLKSSHDPSLSTPSETSPLLRVNEEHGDEKEHRPDDTFLNRFRRRFMRSLGRPRNPGNEAREKIEANAREFVQRVESTFMPRVV